MVTVGGEPVAWVLAQTVGLALLACAVAGGAAFVFRLYTADSIPEGAALILGLGGVGIVLNTRNLLTQFIGAGTVDVTASAAAIDVAIFVVAAFSASAGRLLGDRFGASERFRPGTLGRDLQGPLVRATGRTITVTLPSTIEDIDGYDPVAEETKRALEGQSLDFPRRLTVDALEERLAERLKEDHDVGYVDVDLEPDGTVDHLGLGRRPAGLGATLPSGSVVVAVPCDPAFSASPGDTIQLWRNDDGDPTRVATGELRAVAGTVATVVVDEGVAPSIDPTATYRLVTLPSDVRPDREFAGVLRRSDETMGVVELPAESPLVDAPVGALDLTVIAVRTAAGTIETLPADGRRLAAGEAVIALGHPADLRGLQTAAQGTAIDPASVVESATRVESVESSG